MYKKKSKKSRTVTSGIVHVFAALNNTIITVTDQLGNVISWSSGGQEFSGSRKGTWLAAEKATTTAMNKAIQNFGLKSVVVHVKGPGPGRDAATKSLMTLGVSVLLIVEKTPIPHNGVRAPKKRRV